jgi:hypothetical protein
MRIEERRRQMNRRSILGTIGLSDGLLVQDKEVLIQMPIALDESKSRHQFIRRYEIQDRVRACVVRGPVDGRFLV